MINIWQTKNWTHNAYLVGALNMLKLLQPPADTVYSSKRRFRIVTAFLDCFRRLASSPTALKPIDQNQITARNF